MKKNVFILLTCFIFCFLIGCKTSNNETITDVPEKIIATEDTIVLTVEPGEYWQSKLKVFIFSIDSTPQMAAWIENEQGQYISTVAITNRTANKAFKGAPKGLVVEALPVWNHLQQNNPEQNNLDAVSTATPMGTVEVRIDKRQFTDGNTYYVLLEINSGSDYNEYWTRKKTGQNGQPSVIYRAQFTTESSGFIDLEPVGYGSVDGSNGNITYELDTLTTALQILKNVYLTIK